MGCDTTIIKEDLVSNNDIPSKQEEEEKFNDFDEIGSK